MKNKKAPFADKLAHAMNESINTPGAMSVETWPCGNHWHIVVSPALRELVGGEQDGQEVFPPFTCDFNNFLKTAFDKTPKVLFESSQETVPNILCHGKINGVRCRLAILACPRPDRTPMEICYMEGPKKGEVERRAPVPRQIEEQGEEE